MNITKYIDAVDGFDEAWMEMYDNHVVSVLGPEYIIENTVITDDEKNLTELFEQTYDCKLTQRGKAHHFWYDFDSIRFNSEQAHTMFILKWS